MTSDDYTSDDAKAALKFIYEALPQVKQAKLHGLLVDLVCYLTLTGERKREEKAKFAKPIGQGIDPMNMMEGKESGNGVQSSSRM